MKLEGKRVAYITLGCKLNFSETSTIRHHLEARGTITVEDASSADIVVINTCSVTDVAEKKGRQLIRKTVHRNPGVFIAVVGCYAQLRAREIEAIEGVGLVLGAGEKFKLATYLAREEVRIPERSGPCDIFGISHFDMAYSYGDRTRSFLKIQDGCDYFCTYCTIPFARGKSRSATIEEVVRTVKETASRGVREIILTGVNTGDFGRTSGESLMGLLHNLEACKEIDRFRISSIEPNLLTDEIIEFIASSRRFMPHFHIPLQSGSDEVLRLMKRRYTTALFEEKIALIRLRIPDAFIGVDLIAGMRGEREELFEESCRFVESLDISQLHVFPYSERSGTKALEIPFAVSQREKHERVERLLGISARKTADFYNRFEGEIRPVLFEERHETATIEGFTDNYIRVELPYSPDYANKILNIKLGKTIENGHLSGNIAGNSLTEN